MEQKYQIGNEWRCEASLTETDEYSTACTNDDCI